MLRRTDTQNVVQDFIRFGCRRTIRAFGKDFTLDTVGVFRTDLIFRRARSQHVAFDFEQFFITYLIGTLALAGIFPFAGFWSKDEILANAWLKGFAGGSFLSSAGGFIAFVLLF